MKRFHFILLIFIINIIACNIQKNNKTITEDYYIKLNYNGGMIPEYEEIYLSTERAYYQGKKQTIDGYKTIDKKFSCTFNEIKTIVNKAEDLGFFSMKSDNQGEVYDRGGTKIEMGTKEKPYYVSDEGSYFLQDKYKENFQKLVNEIRNFTSNK